MIFLEQFGINNISTLNFQRLQIAVVLQVRAILFAFEKCTRAYLFQIALEFMWLLVQTKRTRYSWAPITLLPGLQSSLVRKF